MVVLLRAAAPVWQPRAPSRWVRPPPSPANPECSPATPEEAAPAAATIRGPPRAHVADAPHQRPCAPHCAAALLLLASALLAAPLGADAQAKTNAYTYTLTTTSAGLTPSTIGVNSARNAPAAPLRFSLTRRLQAGQAAGVCACARLCAFGRYKRLWLSALQSEGGCHRASRA